MVNLKNAIVSLLDENGVVVSQVDDIGDTKDVFTITLDSSTDFVIITAQQEEDDESSISAPHDFGSGMDAIANSDYNDASMEAANDNLYQQHAQNNNNNNDPISKEEALDLIQVIDRETVPHQCNVAITRDLSDWYKKT